MTPEQIDKIRKYARKFKKTEIFKKDIENRLEREEFFKEALKKENLEKWMNTRLVKLYLICELHLFGKMLITK